MKKKYITLLVLVLISIGMFIFYLSYGMDFNAHNNEYKTIIFETFSIAMLIVISIIFAFLVIYSIEFRRNEAAGAFLPIMVFSLAVINGTICGKTLNILFEDISTGMVMHIEHIAIAVFIIMFFYSVHFIDKRIISRTVTRYITLGYIILGVISTFMQVSYDYIGAAIIGAACVLILALFISLIFKFIFNKENIIKIQECILMILIIYFLNVYFLNIFILTIGININIKPALFSSVVFAFLWFFLIAFRINMADIELKAAESELKSMYDELEVHQNEILAAYEVMEIEIEERTQELQEANELLRSEVEQRKENEKEIERLAFYDQLTNIPNRHYFEEYFDKTLSNAKRYSDSFTALYMDLDGFKSVNDNFGHDIGDIVLKNVGEILESTIRKGDFAARLGGDEFVVILNHLDEAESIKRICSEIVKKISQKMEIYENTINIGVSIGIVSYPSDGIDKEILIKKADQAMYYAKSSSEYNFVFSDKI